jgi:hypothetical protein
MAIASSPQPLHFVYFQIFVFFWFDFNCDGHQEEPPVTFQDANETWNLWMELSNFPPLLDASLHFRFVFSVRSSSSSEATWTNHSHDIRPIMKMNDELEVLSHN